MKKIDFSIIRKDLESYDGLREKVIISSRTVLKAAKQLIYAVHRDSKTESEKHKINLEKEFDKLNTTLTKHPSLKHEGSYNEAAQEYAEGMLYFDYVFSENQTLKSYEDLKISQTNYLLAISDLTGELVRKAVNSVIKHKKDDVYEIQEFVQKIYKELLNFNFRNGQLRKKFDVIRWNLNKLEDVLYDLEIKK